MQSLQKDDDRAIGQSYHRQDTIVSLQTETVTYDLSIYRMLFSSLKFILPYEIQSTKQKDEEH